jgi:hypothetical protein
MFLLMMMHFLQQNGMDVSDLSDMPSSTTLDDLIALLGAEMKNEGVGRGHGDCTGKCVVARESWVVFYWLDHYLYEFQFIRKNFSCSDLWHARSSSDDPGVGVQIFVGPDKQHTD